MAKSKSGAKSRSGAKSKSGANKSSDAISLLKADHRAVEALFSQFENAKSPTQKGKIAHQICLELSIHATIEEELFYPAIEGEVEEDMINEAYVEHDGAKMLIAEITAGNPEDRFYDAKVMVLAEEIKHHVKEEEQRDGLFAQAKQADIDMKELGQRIAARKKELKQIFMDDGLPAPIMRSMKGVKVEIGQPAA
jgi:hemerythrin superfamily protein